VPKTLKSFEDSVENLIIQKFWKWRTKFILQKHFARCCNDCGWCYNSSFWLSDRWEPQHIWPI